MHNSELVFRSEMQGLAKSMEKVTTILLWFWESTAISASFLLHSGESQLLQVPHHDHCPAVTQDKPPHCTLSHRLFLGCAPFVNANSTLMRCPRISDPSIFFWAACACSNSPYSTIAYPYGSTTTCFVRAFGTDAMFSFFHVLSVSKHANWIVQRGI